MSGQKTAGSVSRLSPAVHVDLDGDAVERALIKSKMTKGELAKYAEVHPTTLSKWLSGHRQPTRDQAAVLAWVLRVKLDDIAEDRVTCPHCGSAVAA